MGLYEESVGLDSKAMEEQAKADVGPAGYPVAPKKKGHKREDSGTALLYAGGIIAGLFGLSYLAKKGR